MNKELLNTYYKLFNTSAFRCLYPGLDCLDRPIKAHSIQNAKVFDLLHEDDHLIGLILKNNEKHQPLITFQSVGRNTASTFEGLCKKHDNELFKLIDDFEFNPTNKEQLFLLAYRSVLKELHASISKALKNQIMYFKKAELGIISKDAPTPEGLFSIQNMIDAYDTNIYKEKFDDVLLNQKYELLEHRIFEIETEHATIACSQLFSEDSVLFEDTVARITMNIFPVNHKLTYAIFTSTSSEKELMDNYLYKCLESQSYSRSYEISKLIIRNSDCFYINPQHFKTWSEFKKTKILQYLVDTLLVDKDVDSKEYYLF